MTVKELIEKFKEYDEEDEVVFVACYEDNEYVLDMSTSEPGIDRVYIFLEDLC
ncbi:hypothetical protein [Peptoniphilus sp.]|uniref:hypothetical protein n=1 Tax=Peptoniphilus sp. TaxID=1971214 RepID=UPI0039915C36